MDITALRRATENEHRAAEKAMPLLTNDLTFETYVLTLERLYGFVATWEAVCELSAPAWMRTLMTVRRRASLLEQDLQFLSPGFRLARPLQLPLLTTDAEFLGAMYVMEGSRLGGALIARHVEKILSFVPGQGNAYFRGAGAATGQLWTEFLGTLLNRGPEVETEAVIAAAQEMFSFFTEWMLSSPKVRNEREAL